MGTLVFQATLGGSVNLIGPNTASNVNFTLPSADGSSGQALTTNGSGTLSFGTLAVTAGGTGVTTSTGSGNNVLSTSPTLVTPILGTPTSVTLTNATGLPLTTGVTGTLPVANGGTGLTSTPANGALDIGNGTGFTRTTLTAGSNVTITNGAGSITIAATGGGGGSPAGSDTQVQYNNSGAFGASSVFTFNKNATDPQLNLNGTTSSAVQLRATSATGGPYVGLSTNSSGANIYWTWDTAQVPLRFVAAGTEVAKFVTGSGLPTTFQLLNSLSVGGATPTTSGAGITFPATQSASSDANTLDDYEEGTWTPGILFNGSSTGVTYSQQKGNYTKVGNRVFISCYLAVSNKGSSTGNVSINGLPFTSSSATAMYNNATVWADGLSSITGGLQGYNAPNTSTISEIAYLGTGVQTPITNSNCTTNPSFMVNFSYSI